MLNKYDKCIPGLPTLKHLAWDTHFQALSHALTLPKQISRQIKKTMCCTDCGAYDKNNESDLKAVLFGVSMKHWALSRRELIIRTSGLRLPLLLSSQLMGGGGQKTITVNQEISEVEGFDCHYAAVSRVRPYWHYLSMGVTQAEYTSCIHAHQGDQWVPYRRGILSVELSLKAKCM